jgi:hypothetical protein
MKKKNGIIIISFLLVLLSGVGCLARLSKENDFKPATNQTYLSTCGSCHFLYPPELLPAASWEKIIKQLNKHFGESIRIDPQSKKVISKFLMENGTDRSSAQKAGKIMNSLEGRTPSRITEIPYIQKKHRGIKPEVLNRKTIGSLSNCAACHTKAEQGNFNEEYVTIPK